MTVEVHLSERCCRWWSSTAPRRWRTLPPQSIRQLLRAHDLAGMHGKGRKHDPAQTALRAEKSGNGFRLDGTKTFVADGHVADALIVAARTSGEPGEREGEAVGAHVGQRGRAADHLGPGPGAGEQLGAGEALVAGLDDHLVAAARGDHVEQQEQVHPRGPPVSRTTAAAWRP